MAAPPRGRSGGKSGGKARKRAITGGTKRSDSSTRWLKRQLKDPFVAEAGRLGYRSRAAFKLLQIDDRFHLLPRGGRILDLGAAPGGWTQVAVERAGPGGRVVAVDLNEMDPVPGAVCLQADLRAPEGSDQVVHALGGPADAVLSDMAAPATGHAATDHLRVMALAEAALDLAETLLAPGGGFVAKVLQGGSEAALLDRLKRGFAQVRHVKPPASRKDSRELYVVATGFRGTAPN